MSPKNTYLKDITEWLFSNRRLVKCRHAYTSTDLYSIFQCETDNYNSICQRTFVRTLNTISKSSVNKRYQLHKHEVTTRKYVYILLGATDQTSLSRFINISQRYRKPHQRLSMSLPVVQDTNQQTNHHKSHQKSNQQRHQPSNHHKSH